MITLLWKKKWPAFLALLLISGFGQTHAQTCPTNQNLIENGSFEDAGTIGTISFDPQPGWVQSGPGNNGMIETWSVYGPDAEDGLNFIELNTYNLGIVSQTVTVEPGKPLDFSYYHMVRRSPDEMVRVEFVDPATGNIISSVESTGGFDEWKKISATVVPPGNQLTIRFVSLNSSENDVSAGNFIDNVSLNYSSCDCSKQRSITSVKEVCGANSKLSVTDCPGTVTWSNGQTGTSISAAPGTYTATCTIGSGATACTTPPDTITVTAPCPVAGNLLVNGSFEALPLGNGSIAIRTEPGWSESAAGNNGKVEVWNNYGWAAKDGTRFIELNNATYGVLSQTATVQPGAPMTLSFYHRARVANTYGAYAIPESVRVDFIDSPTNTVISNVTSQAVYGAWTKVSSSFVPMSNKVTIKFVSLNGSNAHTATPTANASMGIANQGNSIDGVSLVYEACACTCIPNAPVAASNTTLVSKCQPGAVLTASGCDTGTIRWNNGATGDTLVTNTPGTYTSQCILPGITCASPASNPIVLTAAPDIEVTCPVTTFAGNGSYRVKFCIRNNGATPVSGNDTIVINGENSFTGSFTDLAPGDSTCVEYVKSLLACGSTANITVKAALLNDTLDVCPANNSCNATQLVQCFPPVVPVGPPGPLDPNYKVVNPKRSLEGGIFKTDEWLTYTVHCQNDGLGICHNAIMVDTIDTSKLDISTLQILSSWDPVQFRSINANTVAFDFIGVNLTSSFNDLPNSQTEVTFKIKRRPGQPVGTEIYNMVGIYFDTNHVVNTNYAASKIIEPCPASQVSAGVVNADTLIEPGDSLSRTFRLSGYNGLITGWEISTDSTFATNVQRNYNLNVTYAFNGVVNAATYVRALVQTGGCAIAGSKPAVISVACGNLIKNGSFEYPALTTNSYTFTTIPYWTNLADLNKIELHRLLLTPAANGSQYIEMNGYAFGDIHQDFNADGGELLNWSLDHKARINVNERITVILSNPDGSNASAPVTHVGSIASWQKVTGSYQMAPGQTAVRMRIISSSNVGTYGNLLDNVKVKYAYCSGATAMSANHVAIQNAELVNTSVSLDVHPNPVNTLATVALSGFETGTIALELFNTMGQLVKSHKVQYTQGSAVSIDLSELKAGTYVIKAIQGGKLATAKIVKH